MHSAFTDSSIHNAPNCCHTHHWQVSNNPASLSFTSSTSNLSSLRLPPQISPTPGANRSTAATCTQRERDRQIDRYTEREKERERERRDLGQKGGGGEGGRERELKACKIGYIHSYGIIRTEEEKTRQLEPGDIYRFRIMSILSSIEGFKSCGEIGHKYWSATAMLHQVSLMFLLQVTTPLKQTNKEIKICIWSV